MQWWCAAAAVVVVAVAVVGTHSTRKFKKTVRLVELDNGVDPVEFQEFLALQNTDGRAGSVLVPYVWRKKEKKLHVHVHVRKDAIASLQSAGGGGGGGGGAASGGGEGGAACGDDGTDGSTQLLSTYLTKVIRDIAARKQRHARGRKARGDLLTRPFWPNRPHDVLVSSARLRAFWCNPSRVSIHSS
jgi:hypothetical protein